MILVQLTWVETEIPTIVDAPVLSREAFGAERILEVRFKQRRPESATSTPGDATCVE